MDRYGRDVLGFPAPTRPVSARVPARMGEVVEEVETGFVGAITRIEKIGGMHVVTLADRHGRERGFRLGPGFWIAGKPVELVAPLGKVSRPTRTASGSLLAPQSPARVARAARIWVEGKHDAELIEKIWGADLRVEGIVVEMLDGIDHLARKVEEFSPHREARLGVLVDHLVAGTKESRIAAEVMAQAPVGTVLVLGHPYVDVWQAVRPARLGLEKWPTIARGTDWKRGICAHLGWPHATQADLASAWQRILGRVNNWMDVEPSLLGRVEELIDFLTT